MPALGGLSSRRQCGQLPHSSVATQRWRCSEYQWHCIGSTTSNKGAMAMLCGLLPAPPSRLPKAMLPLRLLLRCAASPRVRAGHVSQRQRARPTSCPIGCILISDRSAAAFVQRNPGVRSAAPVTTMSTDVHGLVRAGGERTRLNKSRPPATGMLMLASNWRGKRPCGLGDTTLRSHEDSKPRLTCNAKAGCEHCRTRYIRQGGEDTSGMQHAAELAYVLGTACTILDHAAITLTMIVWPHSHNMPPPSEPVSPKATPLPPLPVKDPLTPPQWKTLLAIADTVVPAIKPVSTANASSDVAIADNDYATAIAALRALTPEEDPDTDTAAKQYLAENASSNPAFKSDLQRLFSMYMPQSTKNKLLMVLNILKSVILPAAQRPVIPFDITTSSSSITRAGSFALTGYLTPISEQPAQIREAIVKGWSTARLGAIRELHRSLTVLFKQTWIKVTPSLRRVLGIPRVPIGMKPGKAFEYHFIQFPPDDQPETIETDVVIVGSGCGGAVSAKNLAEAGHRVLVVENSYHWTPNHFPMSELQGLHHLFMNGALISSDDTSTNIVAGQSWGGGGTVNWSASLQTQAYVRREWAERGLPFFTSTEFQDSLDRICHRMGVSTGFIKHNPANEKLLQGARKLGWSHKPVPQNTGGSQHYCGFCTLGCGSCEKQGPSVSYLPDAARSGAQFIEGFHAEKVVFSNEGGKRVATGLFGTWTSRDVNGGVASTPLITRKVLIKAKRVVVSAGTMQSPLLLLRSGLSNYQIGRNLYVHPVAFLGAIYKEAINPWEGGILTSVVDEFENLDGKGHGIKLEATNMIPSSWLTWLDWKGGLQYKLDAARFKHMTGYISIARESDTGRVYPDPVDGRVRFQYSPSTKAKQHIIEGLLALAKIQYVQGASEIFTAIPGMRPFIRDASMPQPHDGIDDPAFQAWLEEIKWKGFPSPESMFVSAHQMGTCRMSAAEKDGVVDAHGNVWGIEGLYVADASVFPSASGVNPMVTNMAIADYISMGIARGL
ncbi:hypothetical protein BDU57DRAFT_531159 [Ampelomyces quisqualis]|uniref:Long-chain-alcohol oxidase n=1 Tax=Ampelomyces quisqualis TaxID=50730 RepID=A0A6A5QGT6_AMPQU|nr:hypothetical protein BDU57DRAFT_531159 [Ampelomyces quisqualis]